MYKNGLEKFLVGNNVDVSVLQESTEQSTHYVLMKISLFGKNTYAVCALGDGYALEVIGEDVIKSHELFEAIIDATPSPCHIYDIVTDFRRDRE